MSGTGLRRANGQERAPESGYAYIMALFMIVAMIVLSQAVMKNWVTAGRRQRESEMIWRGNQYVRAIRMYFRKTGRYPQSLDDLQKGLPDLHFLRASTYADPMNRADGSWRLIYVNAAGQISCSVRYASLQQMALMDINGGKLPDTASGSGTSTAFSQSPSGAGDLGASGSAARQTGQIENASPFGSSGMSGGTTGLGSSTSGGSANYSAAVLQAKPTGVCDGPVVGAFLTGVAGGHDYDRPSVKVYKGGTSYQQWEFIWNPLEEQARAIQNGLAAQGQQPGLLGLPIAGPNNGTTIGPTSPNPPGGIQQGPVSPQLPQQQPQPPDQPLVQ